MDAADIRLPGYYSCYAGDMQDVVEKRCFAERFRILRDGIRLPRPVVMSCTVILYLCWRMDALCGCEDVVIVLAVGGN